jgi:membrane fusion protein, multidrug efflux system
LIFQSLESLRPTTEPVLLPFKLFLKKNRWKGTLLLLLALYSCNRTSQQTADLKPEEFPVVEVFGKDVSVPLEYVASIEAIQNVEIRARVEGYLEEIYVDEGGLVKSGQLLFKINGEEYQAEVSRARANIASGEAETKTAQVELERIKMLVAKNVVAKTEMDLAEAKLEIARSKIKIAQAEEKAAEIKFANTSIRAPFTGVIDLLPFKKGSLVTEGMLLTTVSDIETMSAYFNVSEVEYLEFLQNDTRSDTSMLNHAELVLADGTLYPLKGKIGAIGSEFREGTGAIAVRARFKNPQHVLKHGASGKVRLQEVVRRALLIPQKSALEIQDKNFVFRVDKNNTVLMKGFVPLRRFGDYYIVSKGLDEHDIIVFEGVQNLREGMVITPLKISNEDLLKSTALNPDK